MSNEVVYTSEDFYISYLEHPSELAQALDSTVALALGNPKPNFQSETALCVRDTTACFGVAFYILYGDHREAYKQIVERGLDACLNYFRHNLVHVAHSSDRLPSALH